jgi:hypothetical protein
MQSFHQKLLDDFVERLSETVGWCTGSDAQFTAFRSPQLDPHFLTEDEGCPFDYDTWQLMVKHVVATRKQLLPDTQRDNLDRLAGSRLIAFDPLDTLSDGAAQVASEGFFDVDNVPPWDTWLCFVDERAGELKMHHWQPWDSYLLSWVPAHLVETIDHAIDVIPEQCVLWATDLETPFIRQLKRRGWVHC